jgi:hypothetical protein
MHSQRDSKARPCVQLLPPLFTHIFPPVSILVEVFAKTIYCLSNIYYVQIKWLAIIIYMTKVHMHLSRQEQ